MDESKIKKSIFNYFNYIYNHIMNIKIAYTKYIPVLSKILDFNTIDLKANVDVHDMSKFSIEEFEPYRKRFYPSDTSEELHDGDEEYELALKHHYSNNPHHPQYYVKENGDIEDVPDLYIAEMVLDWASFGGEYWKRLDDNKLFINNKTINKIMYVLKRMRKFDEENKVVI